MVRMFFTALVLILGLVITFFAWERTRDVQTAALTSYLEARNRDALSRIQVRLVRYEQALLATRGLFDTLGPVSRAQFRDFVAGVEVSKRLPGIQGIGYAVVLPADRLDDHVAEVRREGFASYALRPEGPRVLYTSIVYLEPFSDRNLRAFGYDMYSEAVRREAMDRAATTGAPALSGRVKLVQETGVNVQAGFLVYVPVYRKGTDPQTPQERRSNLVGWVYAPFRMGDFMQGVLGEGELDLDLEVFEGVPQNNTSPMFDLDPNHPLRRETSPPLAQTLTFGGHAWTVITRALAPLPARSLSNAPLVALLFGLSVSLLLALTAFLILSRLEKARQLNATLDHLVQERTVELTESERLARSAADTLQRERQRLASIIAGTNAGTWEWNVQTGEVLFNERWAEILGYTLAELAPVSITTWTSLAHPDDLKRSEELLALHFAGTVDYYACETRMRHKDGSWVWVQDRGAVASWTDGKPQMVMGTHTDITERKRAQAASEELREQNHLFQKGESLARMAASIAHHFNNKLQAVLANLDLAESRAQGGASPHLTLARRSVDQAAEVSRLLLVYLGQSSVTRERCVLSEVLRLTLPLNTGPLPQGGRWQIDLPAGGPEVRANVEQMGQLLAALLANAREALGVGGLVRVTLLPCPAHEIPQHRFPVTWQPTQSDYVCLEVTDTGSGIAADDFEKLFDPFFTTKSVGRGLGLPVALGIAQTHSGAIAVESTVGQGSRFRVFLPTASEETLDASETPALGRPGGTVLLVDDDEFLLEPTAELIELLGFHVLTARDGVEALETLGQQEEEFSCVITDLTMPRMGGWELLSALRASHPDLPVIFISGFDKARILSDEHPERPQGFLSKPFDVEQLRAELERVLGHRR